MSSAPAAVKPGDVLAGKYRVEKILGAGGMGYVVAARHLQLDQLVAMKFLRKGAVESSEASMRFLREAKAVVKLRNEHVAKVYDVGTLESGEPYIVMEHLDGCDLAALAKQRHTLDVGEAVEYVMQACEALAEAHTLGIVHRDIKLANLFVTRGPAGGPLVKVLDFGISKTNPFGESEHDMTRTASMLGSPRFMSPEQMRDPRAVDARSDIWSLGVVLYRLVAGHPPFEADTLGRLLTMVMHEQEPPLSAVRHDLPHGFDIVVGRCLQKDPNQRFSNVAELAYALVPFSVDPARARSSADRIAAVLSLPMLPPITGDISIPISVGAPASSRSHSGRISNPPGASDTGTAAPWAGTHGGGSRTPRTGSRGTTIWLGVALAGILVGSAIFAKVRRDQQHDAQAQARAEQQQAAAAQQLPVVTATMTASPNPPPATQPSFDPSPTPPAAVVIGASPSTQQQQPQPVAAAPQSPPRGAAVVRGGTRKQPTPPSSPRPSTPSPKSNEGDGIPTTRD